MSSSLAKQFCDAGKELAASSSADFAPTLNQILNRFLGWPFRATTGSAVDSDSRTTGIFGTLVYTASNEDPAANPIKVAADSLACAVDVSEALDLAGLRAAHERIAQAKRLRKSHVPETKGAPHTTVTLGIIFAAQSLVPLEALADELDRLNQNTPSTQWPDMIVVQSVGTINYCVQFPGEGISGDFLPPAEGALSSGVPPIYVVIVMKPTGQYTFNRMCAFLIAHLTIFSPGAKLPNWSEILEAVPKTALTLRGYQYNLHGDLLPVPRQYYQDRYLAPRPLRIDDPQGKLLSTIQFLPWQDGGVVLVKGKLPLEGLLVFLGKDALKGKITRNDLQISYVLPITAEGFAILLQRIRDQSNLRLRSEETEFVVQKIADEGSSSPFMARLYMGILRLRDNAFPDLAERRDFDKSYEFVMANLLNARRTAQDIARMFNEHAHKVAGGEIARLQGHTLRIDESIDKELRTMTENHLNSACRALKQGMQELTKKFGVDIGFLFKKADTFSTGITTLKGSDADLAEYLSHAREWSDRLILCRNTMEHVASVLSLVQYSHTSDAIQVHEPLISGQRVTEFTGYMTDRLACFVEEVTAHCLQKSLPPALSIRELPLQQRQPELAERFQITLKCGGMPIWRIKYHESPFAQT